MEQTTISVNKSQLRGLYAIADAQLLGDNLLPAVEACLEGGCRLIQLRDKTKDAQLEKQNAVAVNKICTQFDAALIINDNVELAMSCSATGVHLGKNDLPISEARKLLGNNTVIGVSCYDQLQLAITAENNGADYVAFGSMFPSTTKPEAVRASIELISLAKRTLNIPVCAIGGLNINNVSSVIDAGADMTAVISGIFSCPDIYQSTQQLVNISRKPIC